MAEKTSPRGRLLTFVIFGALVLLGVLLLWLYWEGGAEPPAAKPPAENVRHVLLKTRPSAPLPSEEAIASVPFRRQIPPTT